MPFKPSLHVKVIEFDVPNHCIELVPTPQNYRSMHNETVAVTFLGDPPPWTSCTTATTWPKKTKRLFWTINGRIGSRD